MPQISKKRFEGLKTSIRASFSAPSVMVIELTDECNANCIMCPREHMTHEPIRMDFELFKKVVEEGNRLGIKVYQLSFFGESLLLEDFGSRLSYIKETIPGSVVVTRTNAALLTEPVASDLLKRGMDAFMISLDGNNREEFNAIRHGLEYNTVEANIKTLRKLRDEGGYATQISIWALNTKDHPIDEKSFHENWDAWVDAIAIRDEHDVRVTKHEPFWNKVAPCELLLTQMIVRANGTVVQCQYDWLGYTNMGSLRTQSGPEVWNSFKFRLYRFINIIGLKKVFLMCRKCDLPIVSGAFSRPAARPKATKSWLPIP